MKLPKGYLFAPHYKTMAEIVIMRDEGKLTNTNAKQIIRDLSVLQRFNGHDFEIVTQK